MKSREPNLPSISAANSGDDSRISALLRAAERQPAVSAERFKRVRGAVKSNWKAGVQQREYWRMGLRFAIAGVALIVFALGITFYRSPRKEIVATAERIVGEVKSAQLNVKSGTALLSGATMETSTESRASVRLANGISLRLDQSTKIALLSSGSVRLEKGAVYVDTDGANPGVSGKSLEILTPYGTARDEGTQFETRIQDHALRLRVREGKVKLQREKSVEQAEAGEELNAKATGSVSRGTVSPHDVDWNWTTQVAPAFVLEGKSLAEFLNWAARENGWTINYADKRLELIAPSIHLHGTWESLSPSEAVPAILETCGLKSRIQQGVLWVENAE